MDVGGWEQASFVAFDRLGCANCVRDHAYIENEFGFARAARPESEAL